MVSATNSKISRVDPIFGWLEAYADSDWADRLVRMASGVAPLPICGAVRTVALREERAVPASPARLAWMLRHARQIVPTPSGASRFRARVSDAGRVARALATLDRGASAGIGPMKLEGRTHADCLIECDHAFLWIEGKRTDWLSPSTTYDIKRDQLARNIEAVWSLAEAEGKDYRVLICHEHPLSFQETALIDGYRSGALIDGLPHLPEQVRRAFMTRIGTLTWQRIADEWPRLRALPRLADLGEALTASA